MNIKPIHTESDYQTALLELSAYFNNEPAPGTEDADRFEVLATLVESYEAKNFSFDAPDPIDAIRFRMDEGGLSETDLVPSIGSLTWVNEVLDRKRSLTVAMIRNLHRNLGIPADILIGA